MTTRPPTALATGTKDKERDRDGSHKRKVDSAGSAHTRTSTDSRTRTHGRTPSADHLMVPDRADTALQRKRRDSLNRSQAKEVPPDERQCQSERPARNRKLSSTEYLYPDVEAAKEVFRAERATNPQHRRAPTPYTSRRSSGSIRHNASDRSLRSKVSFDSTRSRGSQRTIRTDSSGQSDTATVAGGTHHLPSNTRLGAAGEVIEYIEVTGLERKDPKHRTFQTAKLKPALRSASRLASRTDLSHQTSRVPTPAAGSSKKKEKPLPSRPMSLVNSLNPFSSSSANPISRSHTRHASAELTDTGPGFDAPGTLHHHIHPEDRSISHSRPLPHARTQSRASGSHNQNQNQTGFRSLFSSLSIGDSSSAPLRSQSRPRQIYAPADDLFDYLRLAEMPSWERWPPSAPGHSSKSRSIWSTGNNSRNKGLDAMGWEWHRRLQLAEAARMQGRALSMWESAGRYWERGIVEFHEENVPAHPIDPNNRWGAQIFALPADGYDTLEFFDELPFQAEDSGLLSWVTGTLLQTAVSTLHMLRHSSQTFTFHLIPAPRPPILSHSSSSVLNTNQPPSPALTQAHGHGHQHFLWEGFGTMVLVNKNNDRDRAMILEIRPPSVVDSKVLKEFARGKNSNNGEQWWGFHGETCVGDVGQANLLQAQVYDSCVQNQVYFFAVTNLKYWVFGQFNAHYTKCTVSPVIERKSRDPSVMQCLSAWVIRSVDERPRGDDRQTPTPYEQGSVRRRTHSNASRSYPQSQSQSHSHAHDRSQSQEYQRQDVPAYSEHRRRRHPSYDDFTPPSSASFSQYQLGIPGGAGAQTVFPVGSTSSYSHSHSHKDFNTTAPGMNMGYGLPGYFDLPPAPSPAPFAYPQPHPNTGMMNYSNSNHHAGSGWGPGAIGVESNHQRPFSPNQSQLQSQGQGQMPSPYNLGLSWYNGGMFSWPGAMR